MWQNNNELDKIPNASAVTNTILETCKVPDIEVTNLLLQKLLYFCSGVYYARTGQKLFEDKIEAWPRGGVVPSIYHEFKHYDKRPITEYALYCTPENESVGGEILFLKDCDDKRYKTTSGLVNIIKKYYGGNLANKLVEQNHKPEDPWSRFIGTEDREIKFEEKDKEYFKNYLILISK